MGRNKKYSTPDRSISGNESKLIAIDFDENQKTNIDIALRFFRMVNPENTISELFISALEHFYGPQDVTKEKKEIDE